MATHRPTLSTHKVSAVLKAMQPGSGASSGCSRADVPGRFFFRMGFPWPRLMSDFTPFG